MGDRQPNPRWAVGHVPDNGRSTSMSTLETQIGQWRAAILRGGSVDEADADELEGHLREQISDLEASGLADDEAFLIAVRRLGQVDLITAEFAREHSDRLWKQLALTHQPDDRPRPVLLMLGFAVLSAVLVQVARLLAGFPEASSPWFLRDVSLFVLPVLAAYFAISRRMSPSRSLALAGVVAVVRS